MKKVIVTIHTCEKDQEKGENHLERYEVTTVEELIRAIRCCETLELQRQDVLWLRYTNEEGLPFMGGMPTVEAASYLSSTILPTVSTNPDTNNTAS